MSSKTSLSFYLELLGRKIFSKRGEAESSPGSGDRTPGTGRPDARQQCLGTQFCLRASGRPEAEPSGSLDFQHFSKFLLLCINFFPMLVGHLALEREERFLLSKTLSFVNFLGSLPNSRILCYNQWPAVRIVNNVNKAEKVKNKN
eukprot:TRINITY_DN2230_c2_g1_i1.p1 TRINITY_DN2230_c2_g1~~TRINITY_DN2230_c2_g1_i1.p1  ORF type:complete len:145 (+),score=9.52 TRINITY_DN2230_c2_g1_i1:172-606(+)